MKRITKSNVFAAEESTNTKFYKISKQELIDNMLWGKNVWVQYLINEFDLEDALDLDSLEGSFIYRDEFYFMVSDYRTVNIDGRDIEPEDLADELPFDELSPFIINDTPKDVIKKITDSDLKLSSIDVDEVAKLMLDDYYLATIAQDAEELGLIELR